jgi:zinc/manganese transport system substrate-binding protein
MKSLKLVASALAVVLLLAGCQSPNKVEGTVKVVASTNMWGNIASEVGGSLISVTSIIQNIGENPHDYKPNDKDKQAIAEANLVIVNGGGFDEPLTELANSSSANKVINVADTAEAVDGKTNPHIWYSVSAVGEIAYKIADELSVLDPNNTATYSENVEKFVDGLTGVAFGYSDVRGETDGAKYLALESVGQWLAEDLGLKDETPAGLLEAVANKANVTDQSVSEAMALLKSKKIKFLFIDEQTQNATTQKLVLAAGDAGVKVIALSEVLPSGVSYLDWMGNLLVQFSG